MSKRIEHSAAAREKLRKGVEQLSQAVTATLGPAGRNVIIDSKETGPVSTKDGVTVAKSIELSDSIENIGARIVKQASIKTADQAGDGTTTSTLLAYCLVNKAMQEIEDGTNVVDVKRDMDAAVSLVIENLKKNSKTITDDNQLFQVATISANGDEEVGKLITSAVERVGSDGVITVEESRTGETRLETVEGMQFDRGYKSPYFVTDNNSMSAVMNKPLILITDERITGAKQILPILEACSQQSRALVIIAEDIDGEALSTLVVNKMRGILQVVAVKAPDFGDRKKATLEDIAILTGGTVVTKEKGLLLSKFQSEWLGEARKITVTKDTTTIIDGKGTEEGLVTRLEEIKAQIDSSNSPYEKEQLQNRLGRLVGGVAIIHVGGHTEIEMKERKDRIDDALHATKAAIEEGILPGGGIALLRAAKQVEAELGQGLRQGHAITLDAIRKPFEVILDNAGWGLSQQDMDSLLESDYWTGYDVRGRKTINTLEAGVIDPAKVTRLALENAASVAGTLLLTECVIAIEEDANKQDDPTDFSQFM